MINLPMPTTHRSFLETACRVLRKDERIVGVAVGGSLAEGGADEYSDVDLVIAVEPAAHAEIMVDRRRLAESLGRLVAAFTGEHVGEPRLLVCLYDDPVLHADLKFVALPDAAPVVDTPVVLWDRDGRLAAVLRGKKGAYPAPNAQWIEDRFWPWAQYLAAKIGRGELFDALEGLFFLRTNVLAPLGLSQRGFPCSGVRRVEQYAPDLAERLTATLAGHDRASLWNALDAAIALYCALRAAAGKGVVRRSDAEQAVMRYIESLRGASSTDGPGGRHRPPTRILPAAPEDAETILSVQRLAFREQGALYNDFALPPLTETAEAITRAFGDSTILKAVDDGGRLVGSIRGHADGDTVHVGRLSVHPNCRRRGIGRALILALEAAFSGKRFEMFTGEKSTGNLRLYESLGYVRYKETRGEDGITLVHLEKQS